MYCSSEVKRKKPGSARFRERLRHSVEKLLPELIMIKPNKVFQAE